MRGRGHDHLPAHRVVVDHARARAGRADRRDDHAHAAQHDARRDRPDLVAGAAQVPEPAVRALRGRHRLDPVLARADRLHVPAAPVLDAPGLRRPAPEPGRARPLHASASSATAPASRTATRIGIDNITWECDYPHSDSTWPHSPETLAKQLDGVPDDEVAKITHENAMRIYQLRPVRAPSEGPVHGRGPARRGARLAAHRSHHRPARVTPKLRLEHPHHRHAQVGHDPVGLGKTNGRRS